MIYRSIAPWITYPRSAGLRRKKVYYAGFLNPATRTYRREVIKDSEGHNVTSKKIADDLTRKRWEDGVPAQGEALGPFLEAFWARGGVYARDKRDQGEPLSLGYLDNSRRAIAKHVRPFLKSVGKDNLPIDRVLPELIKAMMRYVGDKGLSGRTVNTVRQAISVPLSDYWTGKRHPERNPVSLVKKFKEATNERQILSIAEARELLDVLKRGDPRLFVINLQAAFTGLRLGECLGTYHEDVMTETTRIGRKKITEYWLQVRHNWQELEGVKGPKKKSFGEVPIPAMVGEAMLALKPENPWGGPFLYWGASADYPLNKKLVERGLNEALISIGITDEERRHRGLGFHAWRHWYTTYMRRNLDDRTLRKLTRHRTPEMTEHYGGHLTLEERHDATKAAAGLLDLIQGNEP